MARTTVIGYDGSDVAAAALRYAARRAPEGARLAVAHCVTAPVEFLGTVHYETFLERAQERADTLLAGVAEGLPGGVEVETAVLSGPPAKQLVEFAARVDAAEIVVGSSGFGALRGSLLGSTSHALLHETDRPVLVLAQRAAEREARRGRAGGRDESPVVVVGYDGSEGARLALEYAAGRVGPGGRVVAVHAYSAPADWLGAPFYDEALIEQQHRGTEMLRELEEQPPPRVRVETDLLEGPAAAALVRAAHAARASEIVLGSRGLGRFQAALGSVSHALLHETDMPVVVVPARG
jgi:nucleotide-binding universal stress UspA family protein